MFPLAAKAELTCCSHFAAVPLLFLYGCCVDSLNEPGIRGRAGHVGPHRIHGSREWGDELRVRYIEPSANADAANGVQWDSIVQL